MNSAGGNCYHRVMLRRLSLKAYISMWVFLAASMPVIALLLVGTGYGQKQYDAENRHEILLDLQSTASDIQRRLQIELDLANGLSQVLPIETFLYALSALKQGQKLREYDYLAEQATTFFETFQGVRRSLGTVRVIDYHGDTLLKIRNGRRVPATLDRLDAVAIVENGSDVPSFVENLNELRENDVGSLPSPPGFDPQTAVFNTVKPLQHDLDLVGYLAISPPLEPLDRTLDVAARPHKAMLFVVEINAADASRNGLFLYDDVTNTRFSGIGARPHLQDRYPTLMQRAFHLGEGELTQSHPASHLYFIQFNPYPDRLISWMFGFEIDDENLRTPFRHTLGMITIGILLAVLLAALLARLGVRQIAAPVSRLTQGLIAFAEGERTQRLDHQGSAEIQQASKAFNRMADSLAAAESERDRAMQALVQNAKLASVGQLAAGISHEISNPLANIYSLTKLAQRRIGSGDSILSKDIDNIREEAERASRIIRGLLNFSRQVPTKPTVFDLNDWIHKSVELIRHTADPRRVKVRVDLPASAAVYGDRDMLQQALINLLLNAVHASAENAEIDLSTELDESDVKICIRDRGPGIDAAVAEHLFDPFYTTKPEGEGTGLGLSICLGIVQDHGGRLTLGNAPDGGAIACMTLPLTHTTPGTSVE